MVTLKEREREKRIQNTRQRVNGLQKKIMLPAETGRSSSFTFIRRPQNSLTGLSWLLLFSCAAEIISGEEREGTEKMEQKRM